MSVAAERVDPWGMAFVHKIYRRELGLLPGLIAGVAEGDLARAEVVAERLTDVTGAIHHHHVGEDELVWPVLLGRVGDRADLVHRMEQQHARLHELLERLAELEPRWRSTADASQRDELAAVVAETAEVTGEHLADEEEHVVPLIAEYLAPAEWQAFETHGEAFLGAHGVDKAFLWLGIGMEVASAGELEKFFGNMPEEVRALWENEGKKSYAEQQARLLGDR